MTFWFKTASILMFTGVAFGAFGAHALKTKFSPYQMDIYHTAVLYHFLHALGLFVVAWALTQSQDSKIQLAGIFLLGGIILFSGSLYALAFTEIKKLGMITPFGGISFLIGWMLLFFAQIK